MTHVETQKDNEEKKINYNEDDLYLNDWKIGSRHIPDIGSWNNISYD